jgi:hypothetical protein
MLIDPNVDEVTNGERGMLKGIEACIQQQCLVSAVSLIYSTIDALSALTRPIGQINTSRKVFKDWVDQYMDVLTVGCTSADIYGARCGIVHTYSPESDLFRDGDAKAIVYKWRGGPAPDLVAIRGIPKGAIILCVEDLFDALKAAVHNFLEDIGSHRELQDRVTNHIKPLLCYRPWSPVLVYIAA